MTKELLESVLGVNTNYRGTVKGTHDLKFNPCLIFEEYLFDVVDDNGIVKSQGKDKSVNKDTFATMCKNWAYTKYGVGIKSYRHDFFVAKLFDAETGAAINFSIYTSEYSEANAIIKSCEWILTNLS